MNLEELFAIGAARAPAKPALVVGRDGQAPRTLSFAELAADAGRLAAGFSRWGLRKGDRVAFWLGNGPELVAAHLALLRIGAVMVPMNLAYRRREIAHILGDARPRLLLTERDQLPLLAEVGVRDAGPSGGQGGATGEQGGAAQSSVEAVLVAEELDRWRADPGLLRVPSPPPGGDDLALILYTSGTTGRSKGAMISHNNLLATITALLAAWAWRSDDVLLLTLPLFHVHGLVVGLGCALAAGATVRLGRRFDAAAVADELAAGGTTLFFGVPTLYVRLVEELRRRAAAAPGSSARGIAGEALSAADLCFGALRLCCSGSAPLAPETFAAFRELTGHAILERYGMTEAGMILSNPYAGPRLPGQVGTPLPGVSVRITDETGQDVPPGGEGELLVRGANVFSGYWQAPAATAAAFTHDKLGRRWFQSGDLARQDPATGSVTLLGRRQELILSGGLNVYPREIEETLTSFPGVREAAVVGLPHPEWGEVPIAYLVTEGSVDEAELIAFCRRQMAAFKVPRELHRLDALPRNALGKVLKHLLR
ncbi:MAG TPA: AMP-binding protein [Thermoanaerobaculia bacterium]|nr:AMP-binding protein [Thermoanaerobaculia bacterium]